MPPDSELTPVLAEMLRTGTSLDVRGQPVPITPSGVSEAEARILLELAREAGTSTTLETGLAYGVSALAFLQAHAENGGGKHISIDPLQNALLRNAGILNIRRARLHTFHEHIEQSSHAALPALSTADTRLRAALIDGSHSFEFTFLDFLNIDQMLDVGGHIIFHDSWLPGVRKVLSYVLRWRAAHYTPDPRYVPPANPLRRILRAANLLAGHPLEPALVATLSRWELPTMVVLKKIAHATPRDLDAAQTRYLAF